MAPKFIRVLIIEKDDCVPTPTRKATAFRWRLRYGICWLAPTRLRCSCNGCRKLPCSEQAALRKGSHSSAYNRKPTKICATGGRGGIRTHGALAGTPVFKTGALNHSATLPVSPSCGIARRNARCPCGAHVVPMWLPWPGGQAVNHLITNTPIPLIQPQFRRLLTANRWYNITNGTRIPLG